MPMGMRENWEICYQVYLDSQPTTMMVIGGNKKEAMELYFESEWKLTFPNQPLPKRYRIKLEEVDRTFSGYK